LTEGGHFSPIPGFGEEKKLQCNDPKEKKNLE